MPRIKMDSEAEKLQRAREELRERLLLHEPISLRSKTESKYQSTIEFLNDVNQFQKNIELYFYLDEIFGEFGENFPINSYMRIYDMLNLCESNLKFRCIYTRDGLGGWMNILAINESKEGCIETHIKDIISEHYKNPLEKSYDIEIEQLGELRMYLDSLSAKKHVYTSFDEMGCLQYLHFLEFGEAFAFEWHALFCRKYVLTTVADIHSIYKDLKSTGSFRYNKEDLESLLKTFTCDEDLKPTVEMCDDKCSIEWLEFHTHEGIFQRRYKIEKAMLNCPDHHGIDEYALPINVKLVNDTTLLRMTPLFKY